MGSSPARALRAVSLLCALASAACGAPNTPPAATYGAIVSIRGQEVGVEIARSAEEQRLGLGQRDGLDWDTGMLFVYPTPRFAAFWMKGMRFDIDMVWIRGERIVDITHRVPKPESDQADTSLPTYRPNQMADQVLEVPAGYAQARGWRVGDLVTISAPR